MKIYFSIILLFLGFGFYAHYSSEKNNEMPISEIIAGNLEIEGPILLKGLTAYRNGDYITATIEFYPLAEKGNMNAQYFMGSIYEETSPYHEMAVKWYHLAAEQGHVGAQYSLGLKYSSGKGVAKNYKMARKWLELATQKGSKGAESTLRMMDSLVRQ